MDLAWRCDEDDLVDESLLDAKVEVKCVVVVLAPLVEAGEEGVGVIVGCESEYGVCVCDSDGSELGEIDVLLAESR